VALLQRRQELAVERVAQEEDGVLGRLRAITITFKEKRDLGDARTLIALKTV
jgi:hypothetical protein